MIESSGPCHTAWVPVDGASRVKRWGNVSSTICGVVAAVFLLGMLLLTVADVVLRTFFDYPLRGVYELIELMLAGSFFFGLPCVFLRDDNIIVNTIDEIWPRIVPLSSVLHCAIGPDLRSSGVAGLGRGLGFL